MNKTNNNQNIILNKWVDYIHPVSSNSKFVTDNIIRTSTTIFNSKLAKSQFSYTPTSYPSQLKIMILFKLKTINHQYKTISPLQTVNIEDISSLANLFVEYWNLRTDDYFITEYSDIIFTYKIIDDSNLTTKILTPRELNRLKGQSENKTSINPRMTFGGYSLPNTMDFTLWGPYHFIDNKNVIVYKKSSKLEYHIELFDYHQKVTLTLDDKKILTFKDIMNDKANLSTFTRIIKTHEYTFKEGLLVLKKTERKVKFLTKTKQNMYNSKKFITMDLETRIINEEMSSYCVSIYDGQKLYSFYLSEYLNEKEMLKASVKHLMKRKYHNHKVFLHNFSRFDSVFLLTILTYLSEEVYPVVRDGRYIDLKFKFAGKYNLFFRDSLLLLPSSLRNLAKNFKVDNKGLFPYKFVNNKDISLNYEGAVPDYKYFDQVTKEEYDQYCKEFINELWNLKHETIKYCELDCVVLYQVLEKFSDQIFILFRIDVIKYPTLSSLAFAIFRCKFLDNLEIPLINGEIYEFIKKAYTGGSVDVYKPIRDLKDIQEKNKVYRYDVNSLYPFVMKNYPMPSGKPIYFEGDIFNMKSAHPAFKVENEEKPFGIFEVDIISPDNMKIPLLQTRVKTKNGYRTISPIGSWSGHYFSEELYNAAKYGYTFKVKRGYLFKKANLFSNYVDNLYDIKVKSEKDTPNYLIAKLLLNSLYGRLGMNPVCEKHLIISNDKSKDFCSKTNVTNVLDLKNGKELISFLDNPNLTEDNENFSDIKNISVVVSAIVTASARIHMSQFKTDKNFTIYYTDTDSIDINKPLNTKYVGNELGKMKLEHVAEDVTFAGPKMYGLLTKDYEYVKIKGLKNPLPYKTLKILLKKDSKLEIEQEKWYKDVSNAKFHIKNEIYTLMVTDNKRKLLYNEENIFYDTRPLRLENGKIVDDEM